MNKRMFLIAVLLTVLVNKGKIKSIKSVIV